MSLQHKCLLKGFSRHFSQKHSSFPRQGPLHMTRPLVLQTEPLNWMIWRGKVHVSHAPPLFPFVCLFVVCLVGRCDRVCTPEHSTACGSWFSPVISWAPGSELKLLRLAAFPSPCCMDILIYKVHISTVKVYLCILWKSNACECWDHLVIFHFIALGWVACLNKACSSGGHWVLTSSHG